MNNNVFSEIRESILEWFYKNRENYSFRSNRTPYKVWISETILQQTRMNAALDKMENFLQCFPDIQSLANSTEDQVLKAFKGLGYYNRARNLHKGARFIVSHYNGFPEEYDLLLEVPSIGPYTAAAISSICFQKNIPVIDGNIKRIFSRLFQIQSEIYERSFLNELNLILTKIFNDGVIKPGDLNEGLMEFGQKICKVKNPQCDNCVLSKLCLSYRAKNVFKYPIINKRKVKAIVNWKLYFFIYNDQVILNKFNDYYLLKNHTGFPSIIEVNEKTIFSTNGLLFDKFMKFHGSHEFQKGIRHTITDHQIWFSYCIIKLNDMDIMNEDLFCCPYEEVTTHLVSSGLSKTWNKVFEAIIARGGT